TCALPISSTEQPSNRTERASMSLIFSSFTTARNRAQVDIWSLAPPGVSIHALRAVTYRFAKSKRCRIGKQKNELTFHGPRLTFPQGAGKDSRRHIGSSRKRVSTASAFGLSAKRLLLEAKVR